MRLSFGRYIAYNSVIHRMDPRLKLFMLIFLMSSVFVSTGFTGYLLLFLIIINIFFISKLRIKMLLTLLKPILFMFIFLLIINCFFIKNGYVGWHWGGTKETKGPVFKSGGSSIFVFSEKSIYNSLYMSLRIYLMILITTILTATTQPLDLTLALEDLLSPLKIIKFPVHIFSTIISIALRMIPTLIEEASRIMKAQSSRGVDFKNGHLKDKIKSTVSLIIPLLVSAFQKAEDLSYAMDARGYDPYSKRTRNRNYVIKFIDIFILLFISTIIIIIIVQSWTFGTNFTFYNTWYWKNDNWVYGKIPTGFIPLKLPYIDQFVLGL